MLHDNKYILEYIVQHEWDYFLRQLSHGISGTKKDDFQKAIIVFYMILLGFQSTSYLLFPKAKLIENNKDVLTSLLSSINLDENKVMRRLLELNTIAKHSIMDKYNENKDTPHDLHIQITDMMVYLTIHGKFEKQFSIPVKKYRELKKKADDVMIVLLIYRYHFIKFSELTNTCQIIHDFLSKNEASVLEAYASPMNASFSHYCSLFPDIEQSFGSLGSFLRLPLETKFDYIIVNPPDVCEMINIAVHRCWEILSHISTTIFLVSCDTRSAEQLSGQIPKYHYQNQIRNKNKCPIYEDIVHSQYFRDIFVIGKYKYYNSERDNFYQSRTNILIYVLSNNDTSIKFHDFFQRIFDKSSEVHLQHNE